MHGMSAPPTLTPGRPHPDADERQARVQALESEIEALRAENAHLRRQHAQHLVGPNDDARISPPAPLDLALRATVQGVEPLAKLEYEGLLAALASVFPIGVFRVDPTGLLTHVDEALQRIFGLQPEAFANLGWLRLVHPQDVERVRQHWAQSIARSDSLSVEFRLIRASGDTAHLQVRNVPQFNEAGELIGHIGFVQDISSLRELQADALIQEELNRQIIASSPDCTKVLDLQGHVLQMTARGCHLVEVDDFEQVRGTDWTQWWKGENEAQARQAVASAQRGETARFVAFGETFKGTPKWWDTVVSPIHDTRGEPVMLLAVSRDITEQHRQQEHIHQLNNELEVRVQERTEALAETNERLRQTLSDAQALYNQAPCGYHSVDATGTFVLINQTELDWLGCTRDEVVGRLHFRDFVQPEHVPQVVDRLRGVGVGKPQPVLDAEARMAVDGHGQRAMQQLLLHQVAQRLAFWRHGLP